MVHMQKIVPISDRKNINPIEEYIKLLFKF